MTKGIWLDDAVRRKLLRMRRRSAGEGRLALRAQIILSSAEGSQ